MREKVGDIVMFRPRIVGNERDEAIVVAGVSLAVHRHAELQVGVFQCPINLPCAVILCDPIVIVENCDGIPLANKQRELAHGRVDFCVIGGRILRMRQSEWQDQHQCKN